MRRIFFLWIFIVVITRATAQEKSLDVFVQSALQSSPLLKDYSNQRLLNMIDSLRLLAGYGPQVNGSASNSYSPSYNGFGYDYAITNGANFSDLVTVSKKLVSRENLGNQQEAFRLLNLSLEITGKITEQDLKKTVTAQYITAYGSWRQYLFNNDLLQLLGKEEDLLKKLTGGGIYRQTDYLTFLVTMQQQELTTTQAHNQFQNDFAVLSYLSGMQDTSAAGLADPALQVTLPTDPENTVFYRQYGVDSLKLKNQDAAIDFTYKPKVSLYADGGYVSSLAEQPYKNFGISGGVNITVPIYDGKQRKMQHDRIAVQEDIRRNYRDFFKTQYAQQIAQLSQQLRLTQNLISQTDKQIRYTQALLDADRKLLETGDMKMADYILAIGNFLSARNLINQNTVSRLQIINQINYWNRN